MQSNYFVEFRLRGYARKYADWVKSCANIKARQLKIGQSISNKEIPHITLFGPAKIKDIKQVLSAVKETGAKYTLLPFTIGKFSRFDNRASKVIFLDVNPSREMENYRWALAQNLLNVSNTNSPFDTKSSFKFHCTIKKFTNIDDDKFEKLYSYLEKSCTLVDYDLYRKRRNISTLSKIWNFVKKQVFANQEDDRNISQNLLRVTILGRYRKIVAEYDLVLKVLLNRKQALGKYWWNKTIDRYRNLHAQI